MNILWITNILFPEAVALLNGQEELKGSGGWLLGLAEALIESGHVKLTVAGITPLVNKVTMIRGDRIDYYAIPLYGGDKKYEKSFEVAYHDLYTQIKPDVVHIHGTEFPHSLAALRACGVKKTVISLQGIASVISRYYLAGLSYKDIICKPTLHSFLRMSLFQEKRGMEQRGLFEIQLIKEASNIIGRTTWDRSHVWAINPLAKYYHCNEVLRKEFYKGDVWNYNRCNSHSIFLSQGSYPLKGLHKVLEALPLVKRIYPDVCVRVAGPDITYGGGGLKERLKITTYGRIVVRLIKRNKIEDNVEFMGPLNADRMKQEYLRANVFVCPSSIENSPNSLAEAQMLGVPCVASYAGGIPDFMKGCEESLYRFDDVEMMAKKICDIMEKQGSIDTAQLQYAAKKRHSINEIVDNMLSIYSNIANK